MNQPKEQRKRLTVRRPSNFYKLVKSAAARSELDINTYILTMLAIGMRTVHETRSEAPPRAH
jgi:uncharacterized protein (DUF1778 family)